jgi:predicted transposase YdaD
MSIFEYDEEREMELIRQAEFEKGEAYGKAEGRVEGERRGRAADRAEIILNMHQNNFTLEQIALATANTPEEIKEILKNAELMPV